MKQIISTLFLIGLVVACATVNRNDYEEKVRAYLAKFEKNLQASDDIILKQFKVDKSPEVLLRAIHIMQNKDLREDSVQCLINFDAANIVFEDKDIRVEIKALFKSIHPNFDFKEESTLTLWLKSDNGILSICKIEADDFYHNFHGLSFRLKYSKHLANAFRTREVYFNKAAQLQQQYDTIIWYSRHHDSTYYYAVNGVWDDYFNDTDKTKPNYKMGLISANGRVIVPVEFDLIGTIGFDTENIVEVKKDAKVGHFSLEGKELIPAIYDWIIPYQSDSVYALVKSDTTYGWINKDYTYSSGYPDKDAELYIKSFGFVTKSLLLKPGEYTMIEPLDIERIGMAKIIPSQHYVTTGIFREVLDRFVLDYEEFDGETVGTETIDKGKSILNKLTNGLSTLYTKLEVHFLGGREEFYQNHLITFIDKEGNKLGRHELAREYKSAKFVDSTLLEFTLTANASEIFRNAYDWDFNRSEEDWNIPYHVYFKIDKNTNSIERLESPRQFDCTTFVKLDSSYLSGTFYYWNEIKQDTASRKFISPHTIQQMRNEILAFYGYIFPDSKIQEDFKYVSWYEPRFSKYEEFLNDMTEIDRHNLLFLDSLLPIQQTKPSAAM